MVSSFLFTMLEIKPQTSFMVSTLPTEYIPTPLQLLWFGLVFETGSQVAEASHEFLVLLFYLSGAGITSIRHPDQLTLDIFRRRQSKREKE